MISSNSTNGIYNHGLNTPSLNMMSSSGGYGISPNSILTITSQSDAPQPPSPLPLQQFIGLVFVFYNFQFYIILII